MSLFHNQTYQELWLETNCDRCMQPAQSKYRLGQGPGCQILAEALQGSLPKEWKRGREKTIQGAFKCSEFLSKPPVHRRPKAEPEDVAMFDAEEQDYALVPVDGWPDYRRVRTEVDHQ